MTLTHRVPLAISLGDPAGIGAEVVAKALRATSVPAWVFGSGTLAAQSGITNIPRFRYADEAAAMRAHRALIDVPTTETEVHFGEVRPEYGRIALASIDAAVDAASRGICAALVTAPIHKGAVLAAGAKFPGHTELLAEKAGLHQYGREFAMLFDSPSFCVVLLTVHVSLAEAIRRVTAEAVCDLALLTAKEYRRFRGHEPRIAVAGINPHAGEGGVFGREEEAIARGIEMARAHEVEIAGPFPADTVFLAARQGKHDVVMAMYHDQGLIPVKTMHFDASVNVTIGLPYLRCSVDHGTAFDIAGRGIADATPMRYAIDWAERYAMELRR